MSAQQHWTTRQRRTDWRDRPYWTALWLTMWFVVALRVAADIFAGGPGWAPVLHVVGLFCITEIVVAKCAGTVRR